LKGIASAFNDGLHEEICRYRKQVQSKMAGMKNKYKALTAMKDNSGFGWDPRTGMPTAPEFAISLVHTLTRENSEPESCSCAQNLNEYCHELLRPLHTLDFPKQTVGRAQADARRQCR
jgi:hypothetical protein